MGPKGGRTVRSVPWVCCAPATLWCHSRTYLLGPHTTPWGSTLSPVRGWEDWCSRRLISSSRSPIRRGLDMDWVCSSPKSMLVVTEDSSREVWGHLSTLCLTQTLIRQPNQTKPNLWHAKLHFSLIPHLKNYILETNPREASCIFLPWTFSSSGRVKYVAEQGSREGVEGRWEWAARAYQGVLTGNKHCSVYFPAWQVHDHTLQGTVHLQPLCCMGPVGVTNGGQVCGLQDVSTLVEPLTQAGRTWATGVLHGIAWEWLISLSSNWPLKVLKVLPWAGRRV